MNIAELIADMNTLRSCGWGESWDLVSSGSTQDVKPRSGTESTMPAAPCTSANTPKGQPDKKFQDPNVDRVRSLFDFYRLFGFNTVSPHSTYRPQSGSVVNKDLEKSRQDVVEAKRILEDASRPETGPEEGPTLQPPGAWFD